MYEYLYCPKKLYKISVYSLWQRNGAGVELVVIPVFFFYNVIFSLSCIVCARALACSLTLSLSECTCALGGMQEAGWGGRKDACEINICFIFCEKLKNY